ncbi:hypothetical protein [Candidatus Mycoplasma haematohominis]|uniref:hypothetical protein n=1 Tax=Candidatus Mycoplasma haematohominis TaxID=1494318 RepID=UPI001C0A6E38|nr:hypothetical protein [Candidatus Mycoplasma haemohominis]
MNTLAKAGAGTAAIAGTTTTVVVATKNGSSNSEENISSAERKRRQFEKDKAAKESKLSQGILNSIWYKKATKDSDVIYVGDENEKLKKEIEGSGMNFSDGKTEIDNFLKTEDTTLAEKEIKLTKENDQEEYAAKWCELAIKITREPKEEETDANKPYGIFFDWCFEWRNLSEDSDASF